ncbi:hypothetical protein G9A89_017473 [Geosiphon pyriformis]|nr:hypothetical protein G9A89_017473 [Geosiphon pyriformis]
MNRQSNSTNSSRPHNYARAAAQQKSKSPQQPQHPQIQPRQMQQQQTQPTPPGGILPITSSSSNGKPLGSKTQPQQSSTSTNGNVSRTLPATKAPTLKNGTAPVQFKTQGPIPKINSTASIPATTPPIQFGSINQQPSNVPLSSSPVQAAYNTVSGGKVPSQFPKSATTIFGSVIPGTSPELAQPIPIQPTPIGAQSTVSGPERSAAVRFQDSQKTLQSTSPQIILSESKQSSKVSAQPTSHQPIPPLVTISNQLPITTVVNQQQPLTNNIPASHSQQSTNTPPRQHTIHPAHELTPNRKDSISSNVLSNDAPQSQPHHPHPLPHPQPHHSNHNHNNQHNHNHYTSSHHQSRQHPHPKQATGMTPSSTPGQGISGQYSSGRQPREKNIPPGHIPHSPHLNPATASLQNAAALPMSGQHPSIGPMIPAQIPWPPFPRASDYYYMSQHHSHYPYYMAPQYTMPQRIPVPVHGMAPPHPSHSAPVPPVASPNKSKAIPIINPNTKKPELMPKTFTSKKEEPSSPVVVIDKKILDVDKEKEKQALEKQESKAVKIVDPAEKDKEERERREREEEEERKEQAEKEREREAYEKAEREKKEEEERLRKEQEELERKEKQRKEEEERLRKEEEEERLRKEEEEERLRKEEEERLRKEEEERIREEEERLRKEEEERLRKEEEERIRKEEEERIRKEEEERLRKEEEERLRKEEEERIRKEEEERIRKEQEEREERERLEREEEARRVKEEIERKKREEAERIAAEEARKKREKEEQEERERKEREESERKEREEKARKEQEDKAQKEQAEKERLEQECFTKAKSEAELTEKKDEKKYGKGHRPGPLDLSRTTNTPALGSAPLSALGSARIIDDLSSVQYPPNIRSPNPQLNENAEPGKFKYDRSFLMQFMGVCKEKPDNLPALDAIGMEEPKDDKRKTAQRSGTGGGGPSNTRTQHKGSAAQSQYTNMNEFKSPPKTSDERFIQATINLSRPNNAYSGRNTLGPRANSANANLPPSNNIMALNNNPPSSPGRPPSGRRNGRKPQHSQPGAPTIPQDQVAPLEQSENRWVPQTALIVPSSKSSDEVIPIENVQRRVKGLLNKLTLEKFESISDQIIEYANKSKYETDGRILKEVIKLTFLKACDESNFSQMYARLCRKMMEHIDQEIVEENVKNTEGKYVQGGTLFRKYLLNRCQEDFEKGWKINIPVPSNEKGEPDLLSDEYYAAAKAKRIGLGLIKFIGELFKLNMLTERIMHECIKKLLTNHPPEEEETESLCKLLTTVGKQLDEPKAKDHMDAYFNRMQSMADKTLQINNRIRFMLLDVIDLRSNNWVPRRDINAPKTIAQIHEDVAKQKEADDFSRRTASSGGRGLPRMNDQLSRGGSGRRDNKGIPHGGGIAPSNNADGWSTVGGTSSSSRKTGDLSKFGSLSRSKTTSNVSLAPVSGLGGGSRGWKSESRDSSDKGANTSRTNPALPTNTNNTYSLLIHADHSEGRKSLDVSTSNENQKAPTAPAATASTSGERKRLTLLPRGSTVSTPIKMPETSIKESSPEPNATTSVPATSTMTKEESEKKIDSMIAEYWSVLDVAEVSLCLNELPQQYRSNGIQRFIISAIEKKQREVDSVMKLFRQLSSEDIISTEFIKAFADSMPEIEELAPDVPHAYTFTGQLMHGAQIDLKDVPEVLRSLDNSGYEPPSAKVVAVYLKELRSELGEEAYERKIKETNFDIKSVYPDGSNEDIEKFFGKNSNIYLDGLSNGI